MTNNRRPAMDFGEFMTAEHRGLLRFASALCGDPRTAEDIVADVLARAFERWRRIAGLERPAAYVRRMVVNEFISRRRRERRVQVVETIEDHAEPGLELASLHAERDALRVRLSLLPARQRAALVLRYYEDLDDAAIGEVLDCAPGTVRSLVSRALASLRVSTATADSETPLADAPKGAAPC